MKLRHLRYFVGIVEAGSFSRAAVKIHVAQPALSQQIAELELKLGRRLLERTPRGVSPTPAGEVLYREATSILHQVAQLADKVRSIGGEPEGQIQIGMSGALSPSLTGPFLAACREALPKVTLRLVLDDSQSLKQEIRAHTLDLALVYEDEADPAFLREPLYQQQMFVVSYAPIEGVRSISHQQLATLPLIVPGFPNAARPLLERACAAAKVSLNIAAEVDAIPGILSAVRAGVGVAVLPVGNLADMAGLADWPEPLPIEPPLFTTVSAVWLADAPLTPAGDAVRRHLVTFVEEYVHTRRPRGVVPCRPWEIAPAARRVGL
jgi:LysR family transcriptional regulator, nitrogen assimilation regulatory protein